MKKLQTPSVLNFAEPVSKYAGVPEFILGYRTNGQPMTERPRLTSPPAIAELLRQFITPDQIGYREFFWVVCLSRYNQPLGVFNVSSGGIAGTVADPKVIFQIALLTNSSAIVCAHNHPSGNVKPSATDISLTKKIVDAGKLLEVQVLDHIILTPDSFFSMANEGVMPSQTPPQS